MVERVPSVLALSELARIRLADGMDYRPIRKPLGVSAFGINAYTADAGELVIEPHDELGTGSGRHEELYLVVAGEAEFELDGETVPAPVGTLVFARPEQHRVAKALADDTSVLVIGGKPGAAGPPSPFEYWYLAEAESDPTRKYEVAAEGLEHYPENPNLQYNLACYAALAGREEQALEHLQVAFEKRPESREWAATDSDLDSIRSRF
jgi:mannose-6-phosphate isomerase-like protein (cupin superfamily)